MAARKRLIDRLDDAAERTGIPSMVTGHPRRRHYRWLPLVPLAMGVAGVTLGLMQPDRHPLAVTLETVALGLAVLLPLIGPIKPWGSRERADEFDRTVRTRAFLVTFATISGAAALGIWMLAGLALMQRWPSQLLVTQLGVLGTFLFVLYSALPTLHASWATAPIEEE